MKRNNAPKRLDRDRDGVTLMKPLSLVLLAQPTPSASHRDEHLVRELCGRRFEEVLLHRPSGTSLLLHLPRPVAQRPLLVYHIIGLGRRLSRLASNAEPVPSLVPLGEPPIQNRSSVRLACLPYRGPVGESHRHSHCGLGTPPKELTRKRHSEALNESDFYRLADEQEAARLARLECAHIVRNSVPEPPKSLVNSPDVRRPLRAIHNQRARVVRCGALD